MMNAKLNSSLKTLNLTQFVNLRVLYIGNNCCQGVEEVTIVGLKCLNEITIGENAFTKRGYKPEDGKDASRRFWLKDCEFLHELQISAGSFMDYSVCEIENVNRLEVIKIGDLHIGAESFWYASLVLRSGNTDMI